MDTLTHALSGALCARVTAPRAPGPDTLPLGRRVFVGFLAAAFPDLDVLTSYLSPLSYLYHHRGVTHSLLMLPLWALLLSVVFASLWRGRPPWRAYLGVTALAIATHIAGDLITSFGTMIFAPLSDARFALSATFIIDLWFTGIIVAALIASLIWRRSRAPAVAGAAVLAAYVVMQVVLQHRAVDFGEAYARAQGLQGVTVSAVPRPVLPFNWTVIVAEDGRYHYAHVNLVREAVRVASPDAGFIARLNAPYRPLDQALWQHVSRFGERPGEAALAREAFTHPEFRFFRWFAAYPVLLRIDTMNPAQCVWFHDLRFQTPGRTGTPFRYGMCRGADAVWQPFQLVGDERLRVY